jgi:hypothetical protein
MMTPHEQHQRQREAQTPLWQRLRWIDEMGRLALRLQRQVTTPARPPHQPDATR